MVQVALFYPIDLLPQVAHLTDHTGDGEALSCLYDERLVCPLSAVRRPQYPSGRAAFLLIPTCVHFAAIRRPY